MAERRSVVSAACCSTAVSCPWSLIAFFKQMKNAAGHPINDKPKDQQERDFVKKLPPVPPGTYIAILDELIKKSCQEKNDDRRPGYET